jgi:hypothetical protein
MKRLAGGVIAGLIAGVGCGGNPAAPSNTDVVTHLMHVEAASACAALWPSKIPVDLWDVPLRLTRDGSHLSGRTSGTLTRSSPVVFVDLEISGSKVSGGVGGNRSNGTPNLMLAISQLGEPGYVAQVSATAEASGAIVGTLNGRISIFDERTDPSQQWVDCDSAKHRFSLNSIAK